MKLRRLMLPLLLLSSLSCSALASELPNLPAQYACEIRLHTKNGIHPTEYAQSEVRKFPEGPGLFSTVGAKIKDTWLLYFSLLFQDTKAGPGRFILGVRRGRGDLGSQEIAEGRKSLAAGVSLEVDLLDEEADVLARQAGIQAREIQKAEVFCGNSEDFMR